MTNRFLRHLSVVSVLALAGTVAHADVLFGTSGTTSGGSVKGTADFVIGASSMTITLTNTTTTVDDIAKVLDGFEFTLTGGSGLALTSVSATGFEDCTGASCTSVSSFVDHHAKGSPTVGSPYGWTLSPSYSLLAGGGSLKPAGIVNTSVTEQDGISNDQHNDYLMGPVVFNFSFTTAPTDVTAATFIWGTANDPYETTPGRLIPTPEPGAILLLGTAALSLGLGLRKRRQSV